MRMQSTEESFRSFTYEEELQRAKWFKEDLEKGGWSEAYKESEMTCWSKTFRDEQVPIKFLCEFTLPFPAEMFIEMTHPRNVERRSKWDRAFLDYEVLETYPDDGGYVCFMRLKFNWPVTDRSFMLFCPPPKEVDWFGKKSYLLIQKNAWHPSRPAGEDGLIRITNGGNFFVLTPDDKEPAAACNVFTLSNNNYNGCVPSSGIEWLLARKVPPVAFKQYRESLIEGYNKYFKTE